MFEEDIHSAFHTGQTVEDKNSESDYERVGLVCGECLGSAAALNIKRLLRMAVQNELSVEERRFIMMNVVEGKSLREIARMTCTTKDRVSKRIKSARDKLFCKLEYAVLYNDFLRGGF